jgi:non-specific serine/threonine protein kinase
MPINRAPQATPTDAPHNLPLQLTSLVGREREIAEVARLLATTRLLTLTGAGGCGKTRLALQVAADLMDAHADGVWLVELAAVADPALAARTIAVALGLREAPGRDALDSLVEHVRARSLLLVLDNCEHLVAQVARVVDRLLRSAPRLHVLATSREPLNCPGEMTWRVPSLRVPPAASPGGPPVEQVLQFEAVRLFVDRARAVQPRFAVTEQNAAAVAEVCRQLDGIPLAIELAAARLRVFSVEQVEARLDDRFRLLTVGPRTALPRQQTLRATIDWSFALLAQPERVLLRRLSVFAGGWRFEAAEVVSAGDGLQAHAVLDVLTQLVDKSLVIVEERAGAARFRLLETIRQYARDRLHEAGESAAVHDRHLTAYLALAEAAEPALRGREHPIWLARLDEEHDNLRAALDWSLTTSAHESALRLSGALARYWWMRAHHDEARRWLERALAGPPVRTAARMKALHGAGWLAQHRREPATARALLGESLDIARELGDRWTEALVLHSLGRVAYFDGDPAGARALAEQSLTIAESLGDDWLIAWALHLLGLAAYIAADYPTARAYYTRSLDLRRQIGDQEGTVVLLQLLSVIAIRTGEIDTAHALLHEAAPMVQAVLGRWSLAMVLALLAAIAAARGQVVWAVHLGGAAIALGESQQMPLIPLVEAVLTDSLDAARQTLGDAAYAAALAEGRALDPDAAVAAALAGGGPPPALAPTRSGQPTQDDSITMLTPAEARVLRLLAAGRTTKEIAADLSVAISTVDRHITHLYSKLGVRNRAEATATALTRGLVTPASPSA